MHAPRRTHHVIAAQLCRGARVLLERNRVAAEPHDERARVLHDHRHCQKQSNHTTSDYETRIEVTSSFPLMALTTSIPLVTCPNTVCTPSRCRWGEWQMKNWLPPVSLPACAMDSVPATCLCVFFCVSHLIVYPGPPVPTGPLPVLEYGSPPWIMKFGITRWNFVAS